MERMKVMHCGNSSYDPGTPFKLSARRESWWVLRQRLLSLWLGLCPEKGVWTFRGQSQEEKPGKEGGGFVGSPGLGEALPHE